MSSIPVFDGHNDVLLRLWLKKTGDPVTDFIAGDGKGHLDLPRMTAGGFAGGMLAVFVPRLPDYAPAIFVSSWVSESRNRIRPAH